MAIRPVLRMGDARLLQRAEPVSGFGSEELRALLADMRDTMQALNGAGLAAPQIGVNLRVVIFGVRLRHVTAQQPIAGAAACNPLPHQTLTRTVSGVYPGMFVRVHFVVGKASKLVIPASAVLRRSEVVAVYVVDDNGMVKLRQVRLGEAAGQNEIEVLSGLNAGEQVALEPVKAGMSQQAQ